MVNGEAEWFCLPLTADHSPLTTTHQSLLTTHHSPLAIRHSPFAIQRGSAVIFYNLLARVNIRFHARAVARGGLRKNEGASHVLGRRADRSAPGPGAVGVCATFRAGIRVRESGRRPGDDGLPGPRR